MNNYADLIKDRVTTKDACKMYGIEYNRAGFACCISHYEKTPSMKIYDGEKGFHCFGCGLTGDVISFVMTLFQIDFQQAIEKLNDDFSLGFPINKKLSDRERIAIAKANFERKKRLEAKQAELQRLEDEYWQAYEEWLVLDENLRKYEPKDPDEEFHPLFAEALKNIDDAKAKLELAEIRREEYASRSFG